MEIKIVLDNVTSFIMDPSNDNRSPLTQGAAWLTTIILGIGTIGIAQGLSALWRKLRNIDKNDTHTKICEIFQKKFSKSNSSEVSKDESLTTLTKTANKEGDAFLIDFSKIRPSNIFKILTKGSPSGSCDFGDVHISPRISKDENALVASSFPHKYSIMLVVEKNEHGYYSGVSYEFTMNDEGKVESYNEVFDNFDLFLEDRMKHSTYSAEYLNFEYLNLYSVRDNNEHKQLRKRMPPTGAST